MNPAAITILPKPRPTIRVLSAVETRAITELREAAPTLMPDRTGPKRTRRWKRAICESTMGLLFAPATPPMVQNISRSLRVQGGSKRFAPD